MQVVLFGYGSMGVRVFDGLRRLAADVEDPPRIACVFTHEDASGEELWFDSLAERATAAAVPTHRVVPYRLCRPEAFAPEIGLDTIFISAGFRSRIASSSLARVRGAYNFHPSLLPAYRGRSPINWAILHGETEVGLTLHHMVEELDAGPIVAQRRLIIGPDEMIAEVVDRVDADIEPLLVEHWPALANGRAAAAPQDHSVAQYHGGRRPEDGRLDWRWSARRLHNLVRAVSRPFPGAFFERGGRRIFVWQTRVVEVPGPGPGLGVGTSDEGFLLGTGEGVLEVLRFGLDGGSEEAGRGLGSHW